MMPYQQPLSPIVIKPTASFDDVSLGVTPLRDVEILELGTNPLPIGVQDGVLYGQKNGLDLYRSFDSGETWEFIRSFSGGSVPLSIVRHLGDGEVLVVRTIEIYRSTGWSDDPTTATFTPVLTPTPGAWFQEWSFSVYGPYVLVGEYGDRGVGVSVRLSTDYGQTWKKVFELNENTVPNINEAHIHAVEIDPYHDGSVPRLWVSNGDTINGAIRYSDDLGETWTVLVTGQQPTVMTAMPAGILCGTDDGDGQSGYYQSGLRLIERDTLRIRQIYTTPDGGGLTHVAHNAVRGNNGIVYVCALRRGPQRSSVILATRDGITGWPVWQNDPRFYDDGDGSGGPSTQGLEWLYGPTSTGHLIGRLRDAEGNYTILRALESTVGVPEFGQTYDHGHMLGGLATYRRSVAVGPVSRVYASESVAVGPFTKVSQGRSVAVGSNVHVSSFGGIGIGENVTVDGPSHAIAIGRNIENSSQDAVVIGNGIEGVAQYAVAIGALTQVDENSQWAVAIGHLAKAQNIEGPVAIGRNAEATGRSSVAIGFLPKASGQEAVAIGKYAEATLGNAIAIGNTAKASHFNSVVFGPFESTAANQFKLGARHIELDSMSNPAAPADGSLRLFCRTVDDTMELAVRFPDGSIKAVAFVEDE